jgi:hypothetical protein
VIVGRISAVQGPTLTLASRGAGPVQVTVTSGTTVNGVRGGAISALTVGQIAVLTCTQGTDGSVTATPITTRAARTGDQTPVQPGRPSGDAQTAGGAGSAAGAGSTV